MKNVQLQRAIARCLVVALLIALLPTATMWRVAAENHANGYICLDFSAPDGATQTVPASLLADELIIDGLTDAERDYLNTHSQYRIFISSVPFDLYRTIPQGENVKVIAEAYTYVTADGVTVDWIPSLILNEAYDIDFFVWSEDLSAYTATLPATAADTIELYYTADLTLTEADALGIVNEAYLAAKELSEAMSAYQDASAAWTLQNEKYQAYLSDLSAWQAAAEAYDAYRKAMDAHEHYLATVAAWDAYRTWVKYQEDLAAYNAYKDSVDANADEWAAYEQAVTDIRAQLAVLDRMFVTSTYSERSFFGMITGGAANYVMNNQEKVANIAGVKEKDVKGAAKATSRLQTLLTAYQALLTEGDEAAKYAFYVENYEDICTYIGNLYTHMTNLSGVEGVINEIRKEGGYDLLLMMLGHLYVNTNLLDDNVTLDGTTVILNDRGLGDLMEAYFRPTDENRAYPLAESFPEPPALPDGVVEVPYPGDPPAYAEMPSEPEPGADDPASIEPMPVPNPGEAPTVVDHPGEAPTMPTMDESEAALLAAYGTLAMRTTEDLISDLTVTVEQICAVSVQDSARVKVSFADLNGDIYHEAYAAYGAGVVLPTPPAAPAVGTWTFVGWSLSPEGEVAALDSMTEDVCLYPVFIEVTETESESVTETESETETETESESVTEIESESETEKMAGGCKSLVQGGGMTVMCLLLPAAALLLAKKRRRERESEE